MPSGLLGVWEAGGQRRTQLGFRGSPGTRVALNRDADGLVLSLAQTGSPCSCVHRPVTPMRWTVGAPAEAELGLGLSVRGGWGDLVVQRHGGSLVAGQEGQVLRKLGLGSWVRHGTE